MSKDKIVILVAAFIIMAQFYLLEKYRRLIEDYRERLQRNKVSDLELKDPEATDE